MLLLRFFISTAESAPAGIAALVPVGSAPELSRKRTEPQLSCRACGTYLHGLNAPGSNFPIRHVPTPCRYASDRPLDHRALRLQRHDLAVQPAKAEFAPIGRKARQSAASRSQRPIPPPHERPQSQPAGCRSRSGETSGLSPAMRLPRRSAFGSRASGLDSPAKSALRSAMFSRRDGIPEATSGRAAQGPPALAGVRSATGPVESPRRLARPALPLLPPQPNTLIKDEVDDLKHRAQSLRQFLRRWHLVRNRCLSNLCLCAHNALRQRTRSDEEGLCYLLGCQPAHLTQGECNARFRRQRWMTAGKDETEAVVLDLLSS